MGGACSRFERVENTCKMFLSTPEGKLYISGKILLKLI